MVEYHKNQDNTKKDEMQIEEKKTVKDLVIKDRAFFFNIVNTVYPLRLSN